MLILFVVTSCSMNDTLRQLSTIESFVNEDSIGKAERMLNYISKDLLHGDREAETYYNLIRIQIAVEKEEPIALNKINNAIDYYSSMTDNRHLAVAYFCKSAEYYRRKNVSQSLQFLFKARSLSFHNDMVLQYKISKLMAQINLSQGEYSLALREAQQCSLYATQLKNIGNNAVSKYLESVSYKKLGIIDSFKICVRQYIPFVQYAKSQDQSLMFAEMGLFYAEQKEWDNADRYINKVLGMKGNTQIQNVICDYYIRKEDYDKAETILLNELDCTSDYQTKCISYHLLGVIYELKRDFQSATYFLKLESLMADSLRKFRNKSQVTTLQKNYEMEELQKSNTKTISFIWLYIIIFVLISCIIIIVLSNRLSIRNKMLQSSESDIQRYIKDLARLRESNKENEKEYKRKVKQMEKQLDSHTLTLSRGRKLYEGLSLNKFVEKRDIKSMDCVLSYYKLIAPDFFDYIESNYTMLTTQSKLILMLQHMGKTKEDIKELLAVSDSSLRSYLTRIKKCKK